MNNRTKGYKSNPEFDKLLSDIDISGLEYLEMKYRKELDNYKSTHNLNDKDNLNKYLEIKKRLGMIHEEEFKRTLDNLASPSNYKRDIYGRRILDYDSENGIVYDDYNPIYVEFNESENGIISRNYDGGTVYYNVTPSDNKLTSGMFITRSDLYRGWDYWLNAEIEEE